VVNAHAKFEVSSANRSRDMEGFQNSKSWSRDPLLTIFDLFFNFWILATVFNRHAKFKVSISHRSPDMEGFPEFQKLVR